MVVNMSKEIRYSCEIRDGRPMKLLDARISDLEGRDQVKAAILELEQLGFEIDEISIGGVFGSKSVSSPHEIFGDMYKDFEFCVSD
jgi:hypothetical protein